MLDILGTVSSEWRKIGNLTGQSRALDGYERKYMMSDYECISKVFSVWFDTDGTPNYPITWQGLYDLLCTVGHRGIANKIADSTDKAGIKITRQT
jgi:hypothetical protein